MTMAARKPDPSVSVFQPPAKTKYRPEDFIVPGKDSKGESTRVWVRIQPGYERAMKSLVASRKFPFKEVNDIIRLGIHRTIKMLEQMEDVPNYTTPLEAANELLAQEEYFREFGAFMQTADNVISRHMAEGAQGEARRVVAELKATLEKMPVGYWRKKFLKALDDKFGHLIAGGSKTAVAFGTFGEEDD
jgi:hypothetical protein